MVYRALTDPLCSHIGGLVHNIPNNAFSYGLLWGERRICSVANLTREDGRRFFDFISGHPSETRVTPLSLHEANLALEQLRHGKIKGAAALVAVLLHGVNRP